MVLYHSSNAWEEKSKIETVVEKFDKNPPAQLTLITALNDSNSVSSPIIAKQIASPDGSSFSSNKEDATLYNSNNNNEMKPIIEEEKNNNGRTISARSSYNASTDEHFVETDDLLETDENKSSTIIEIKQDHSENNSLSSPIVSPLFSSNTNGTQELKQEFFSLPNNNDGTFPRPVSSEPYPQKILSIIICDYFNLVLNRTPINYCLDDTARMVLTTQISFIPALQSIQHFAMSISDVIVNPSAFLMGIIRGQEIHWKNSRAARAIPGGAFKLLNLPPRLLVAIGQACLNETFLPSDFAPEILLEFYKMNVDLILQTMNAFTQNKRVSAGHTGGVMNRVRFFMGFFAIQKMHMKKKKKQIV